MRDQLANLLARLRATNRQQRLMLALAAVAVIVVLRFGAVWFFEYRGDMKDNIQLSAQRLATARRLVARAPATEKELADLQARYNQTVAELVPGDTPTLAAASLQDRVSLLAGEKNVSLQTTQVLKDEAVSSFRQVSLRITASGELHDLADFLASLEYGPLRVSVPFIELSRRGAVVRRQGGGSGGRPVSATIQISGVIQGSAGPPAPAGETARQPGVEEAAGAAAPDAQAPAPQLDASAGTAPGPAALPESDGMAERQPVPDDPLGTGKLVTTP